MIFEIIGFKSKFIFYRDQNQNSQHFEGLKIYLNLIFIIFIINMRERERERERRVFIHQSSIRLKHTFEDFNYCV